MAKKRQKIKTVYVKPTDEQVQRAIIETTPMKKEMESWMGCEMFTLSCLTLHASIEDLIDFTKRLHLDIVPIWFKDSKPERDFMMTYLGDVEQILKMVLDMKIVKRREEE